MNSCEISVDQHFLSMKTGVQSPLYQKVGVPPYKRLWPPSKKKGVPAPKMGVQDCKSAVSKSSSTVLDLLTSVVLSPDLSFIENSVGPDQLAPDEAS